MVYTRHVIRKVFLTGVSIFQAQGKAFTVGGATAVIVIKHHISSGSHQLQLGGKVLAVRQMGTSMNLEN